eukprot:444324-Rhodomonas_salina.4
MSGADTPHPALDRQEEEENQKDPSPADSERPRRGFEDPNRTCAEASVGRSLPIVLGARYDMSGTDVGYAAMGNRVAEQPCTPDSGGSNGGSIPLSCYAFATESPVLTNGYSGTRSEKTERGTGSIPSRY